MLSEDGYVSFCMTLLNDSLQLSSSSYREVISQKVVTYEDLLLTGSPRSRHVVSLFHKEPQMCEAPAGVPYSP